MFLELVVIWFTEPHCSIYSNDIILEYNYTMKKKKEKRAFIWTYQFDPPWEIKGNRSWDRHTIWRFLFLLNLWSFGHAGGTLNEETNASNESQSCDCPISVFTAPVELLFCGLFTLTEWPWTIQQISMLTMYPRKSP